MKKAHIDKKIWGHLKKIKTLALHTSATLDAEAAHQLRIEYKKLRAFIRLLSDNQLLPQNNKALKKIRPLYKIIGAIRELQLQQEFVATATHKPFKKPVIYLHVLQKQIIVLQTELQQLAIKKMIRSAKEKLIDHLPKQVDSNKFIAYFQSRKTAAEKIIATGKFSDSNLHTIRKVLKDLCHNLFTCQQYGILKKRQQVKKILQHYELLLKEMGTFHDKCTAIALLQQYLRTLPDTTQSTLLQIKKNWLQEKQLLKKALIKKLKAGVLLLP